METNEMLEIIGDGEFIDKIYNFSYHRCNNSHEAEDLCSDILLALIAALKKQGRVENFYAFVWTLSRRVYADFCEKRSKSSQNISLENAEFSVIHDVDEIESFIENEDERERIKKIFAEIAFLSKAYRDVMVMYYIDEMKVRDIAAHLCISETTVKQRLFYARNTVRKEVNKMSNRNLSLKPIRFALSGTGNPIGNDPRTKCERLFSQNLIYLCKDKPMSAKELSDELCVPMPYIEDELDIQVKGENGKYGMLRKLDNGKYISNVLVVDYDEYDAANKIYEKHLPEICAKLKENLKNKREKILSFPFMNEQSDLGFVLWSLISRMCWKLEDEVVNIIREKYFRDIEPVKRDFTTIAIAFRDEENCDFGFYGCDGTTAKSVENYKDVFVANIYGRRIKEHFHCGHNISTDPKLLLTIKAIGGLPVNALLDFEKENVAKAIECGYLHKKGELLEPKMVVLEKEKEKDFFDLANALIENMTSVAEKIAYDLGIFMQKHIPDHLKNEYNIYSQLVAGVRILDRTIEECIKEEILVPPANGIGAEGCWMVVGK